MFSINTLRRLPVALALAGAVCAFTVPQALAGGTPKDSLSAAASDVVERYAATHPVAVPDVVERYAATHPVAVPDVVERYAATHPVAVPDVVERYAASHPYGTEVSSPQQVGVPFYTPAMLAAHHNREDLLYHPRPSLPTNPGPTISRGFDWSDWAIGIGTGLGLALILGGGLLMGRHLRHRGIQTA